MVLHPVSNSRWFLAPTASDVPPTAVTSGLLAGKSTVGAMVPSSWMDSSPLSPEEK